ncbi:MAG: lipopolysaccharide biosynthesis protein [Planctomycetota bacterium]
MPPPVNAAAAADTRSGDVPFERAVKWAFVMNWGQQAIGALLTFVLGARVGLPEFGTASTAAVYILFIQMALEGFATAIIQRQHLKPEHLHSSFWMVLLLSLGLTGVGVGLSDWWASVCKDASPSLGPVIRVLSLSIPIRGLTIVQQAVLQRRMDFKRLALRSNVSVSVGGLCGVVLAFSGFGAWALVAQQLCTDAIALLLLWTVSDWRPRLAFSWSHMRELFSFSLGTFLGNIGVFAGNRLDSLLIPLYFGPGAQALYKMADRLTQVVLEFVTRSLQSVSLSQFARLQDDPPRLRTSVLNTMRMSATASIPAMIAIAATGRYLLRLMGKDWVAGSIALQIFCVVGIARAVQVFIGPLLQARGRPHLLAMLIWIHAGLNAAGFLLAAHWCRNLGTATQITWMASVRVLVTGLLFVPICWRIMSAVCGAPIQSLFLAVLPSLASGAAIAAVVSAIVATGWLADLPAWAALMATVPAGGLAGVAVLLKLDPQVGEVIGRELRKLLRLRVAT